MPDRRLTSGEKALLRPIYGATLPYDDQWIGRNDAEWGGRTNSITLATVPRMAVTIWALDYSASSVSNDDKWIFVHEMGHVWNWYHGGSNMRSGIWTWITQSDYEDAYYYDLADGSRLRSFNFEAQASIIADYWFVSQSLSPKYNTGSRKRLADYQPYIVQVQTSGPPAEPTNVKYANRSGSRPL
jgi:hypothetical protein